jgi:hypothetical protein
MKPLFRNNLIRSLTHSTERFKGAAMKALHNCLIHSPLCQKYFSQDHQDKSSTFSSSSVSSGSSIPDILLSLLCFRIGPPEPLLADQVTAHAHHDEHVAFIQTTEFTNTTMNRTKQPKLLNLKYLPLQCAPYWGIGSNEQLYDALFSLAAVICL